MKVSRVSHRGYADCVQFDNGIVRVVLGHHCGGRVLEYSHAGVNILAQDPAQDGWVRRPGVADIDPWGGRFDIGPEKALPSHPMLWLDTWTVDVNADGVARMTSKVDAVTGAQLVREFQLDATSSRFVCTQTIVNRSTRTQEWCHWGRTLVRGGGICLVPLTEPSRFPSGYVMYQTEGTLLDFAPSDPAVRVRDGMLTVLPTPLHPKLGMDSYAGWLAYLSVDHLLFVKRFATYPERVYSEVAGFPVSIWYYRDELCEIEPLGPRERLAPGESASFTEEWWLLPHAYPARADAFDAAALRATVARETGAGVDP